MADTTKNVNENAKKTDNSPKRVFVTLPPKRGQNANQDEFFSVNGKNYIITRGEEVEIPLELAEVIKNGQKAEAYAMRYVSDLTKAEEEKRRNYN